MGPTVHVAVNGGTVRLEGELRRCHAAYGLPLMVTETSVEGDTSKKCTWVDHLVASLQCLRDDGVPVIGLTWWPLVDFVDWSWASGGLVVEEFLSPRRAGPTAPARVSTWGTGRPGCPVLAPDGDLHASRQTPLVASNGGRHLC